MLNINYLLTLHSAEIILIHVLKLEISKYGYKIEVWDLKWVCHAI